MKFSFGREQKIKRLGEVKIFDGRQKNIVQRSDVKNDSSSNTTQIGTLRGETKNLAGQEQFLRCENDRKLS
jgi:hypothetical protein